MDGACSTYGGLGRCIQGFGGDLREGDRLKDGRIVLNGSSVNRIGVWIGPIGLGMGTGGELLCTRQ